MLSYNEAIEQTVLSFEKLSPEITLETLQYAYSDMVIDRDSENSKFYLDWLDGATDAINLIYDKPYSDVVIDVIQQAMKVQNEREEEEQEEEKELAKARENLARYSTDELLYMFNELKEMFEG